MSNEKRAPTPPECAHPGIVVLSGTGGPGIGVAMPGGVAVMLARYCPTCGRSLTVRDGRVIAVPLSGDVPDPGPCGNGMPHRTLGRDVPESVTRTADDETSRPTGSGEGQP